MSLAELKTLLQKHDIRPVKARGQNFLWDDEVAAAIVDASDVSAGDLVVEIGPGWGILTKELLDRGARVLAVELDRRLFGLLESRFDAPDLSLQQGDVLEFPNQDLFEGFGEAGRAAGGYSVVANIPYAITSEVLTKFLLGEPKPERVTLMVQREVADRITAAPPDMSAIAVMVQTMGHAGKLIDVPRSSFWPSPKVDSAVVRIDLRPEGELDEFFRGVDKAKYFSVVRTAFSAKRKMIRNTLAGFSRDRSMADILKVANISPEERPERLSVPDWIRLVSELTR